MERRHNPAILWSRTGVFSIPQTHTHTHTLWTMQLVNLTRGIICDAPHLEGQTAAAILFSPRVAGPWEPQSLFTSPWRPSSPSQILRSEAAGPPRGPWELSLCRWLIGRTLHQGAWGAKTSAVTPAKKNPGRKSIQLEKDLFLLNCGSSIFRCVYLTFSVLYCYFIAFQRGYIILFTSISLCKSHSYCFSTRTAKTQF